MSLKQVVFFCVFLLSHRVLYSQNHVANPSFEELSGCPTDFFQIYKAPPWFSPNCEPLRPDRHGYAILFTSKNPCSNDLTGVPKNVWCEQNAHSGLSYAGIGVMSAGTFQTEYRQYLETKLRWPLESGRKYLFSMFYNLCYAEAVSSDIICFNTDSLGAYFSQAVFDKNPDCRVLPVSPQVHARSKQISPSPGWYELSGCITAQGNENYVTIGNFARNYFSNCSLIDSIGYLLFVDDVSLIPEIIKHVDTVVCSSEGWTVNAQQLRNEYLTLGGWSYRWNDGSKDSIRKFTIPGNYTLQVINQDCFTDVYNFNIAFINCTCKEYIPTAFTPNGDNLNDNFIPHVVCGTQRMSGYRFSVFDRWGMRIFFTQSETQSWDGTYRGKAVTMGEYAYVVEYKPQPSQTAKISKGTVLLVR